MADEVSRDRKKGCTMPILNRGKRGKQLIIVFSVEGNQSEESWPFGRDWEAR